MTNDNDDMVIPALRKFVVEKGLTGLIMLLVAGFGFYFGVQKYMATNDQDKAVLKQDILTLQNEMREKATKADIQEVRMLIYDGNAQRDQLEAKLDAMDDKFDTKLDKLIYLQLERKR